MQKKGRVCLGWLLVSALVLGASASAQIEVRSKPPTFLKARDGEVIPVVVVADGAKVRRKPSRTASTVSRAKFLDAYFLLDTVEESGTRYHLAGTMDGAWEAPQEIIGWFHEDDVLIERQAIKGSTGIFLKGLVVNQWRVSDEITIKGADLLQGPGRDASGQPYRENGEIGLFSFYFIYKKQQTPQGSFYLLGLSPIIQNVTQPGETLEGWVDSERMVEWPTRQAIQFDKGTLAQRRVGDSEDGAKVFPTEHEVVAHLRGESVLADEPLLPVAVEDAEVEFWQHNWPRFPLFEVKPNREIPSSGSLYHVGFIGDQIYVSGKSGASRGEVARNTEELEKLRSDLKAINLLFVIDSTGSMRKYFKSAADAVLEIAEKVRRQFPVGEAEGPEIRYSVVFYRDYVDEDGEPEPTDTYLTKRLPFTGNQAAVDKFLRDEQRMVCDGCGGDEPEAMFHGLEYAINTAAKELADSVGLRAVVLIGDKGNHLRDPRGYDTEQVARAIEDQSYDFFCFHVVDASWLERDPETRAFRDQCTDIGRRVEMTSQTKKVTSNKPSAIASAIVDAALSLGRDLERTRKATREIIRGEAGLVDIRRQYGVRLTQRLSEMMQDRGIDPSVFVEKSVQVFEQGWVAEKDPLSGARQIETVLLVDRATLEQLQGLLAGLTKQPPSRQNIESLWAKVLKDVTQGEADIDKPVAELIENHLGIPVRKKLLSKTLREISSLDPNELNRLYSELLLDLHRIRGLQAEKRLVIQQKPKGDGGFTLEVKETGSRPVWWQGKGGREYAWIPLDELP